jgi:serine/threonine protein kinase
MLANLEEKERLNPSPRKVLDDRVIHLSYTMPMSYKDPVITDFGAAYLGEPGQKYRDDVMPGVYRAPEVLAGMEWDSKIDIWSIGVMVRLTSLSLISSRLCLWLYRWGTSDLGSF